MGEGGQWLLARTHFGRGATRALMSFIVGCYSIQQRLLILLCSPLSSLRGMNVAWFDAKGTIHGLQHARR